MPRPPDTPGLLRRLGALIYDALIVVALLMLVTALLLIPTGGEAIEAGTPWYSLALLAVAFAFVSGCWVRGGRTLGMQAWRLLVCRDDGSPLRWRDALLRQACALVSLLSFGLGYFWVLVDRDGKAWHDRWSGTRLKLLPKGSAYAQHADAGHGEDQ